MKNAQLADRQQELTLLVEARPRPLPLRPYQRRRQRARWWFREMHRAVEEAASVNRRPAPAQIRLAAAVAGRLAPG